MGATADRSRPEPRPRRVPLPDDRVLLVRPVRAADVDGLAALYAGLDDDSRYRRFFSVYRPRRDFFERMVAVGERGGAGLVAEVGDAAGGHGRIVGEASYELLPDGDGELAITVDGAWRGWLGPYLLDALVETAAERGVPNLEADVLMTNGPMLALLRSRGYVTRPDGDWTVVRALIGTAAPMPSWPGGHHGLRVLVEGATSRWRPAGAVREAGGEVLACPGPGGGVRCPVLAGEPCPLAAGADAIVISHPADTDAWRAVRAAHAGRHPGVPVCVEVPRGGGVTPPGETAVLPCSDADVVALVQHLASERAGAR